MHSQPRGVSSNLVYCTCEEEEAEADDDDDDDDGDDDGSSGGGGGGACMRDAVCYCEQNCSFTKRPDNCMKQQHQHQQQQQHQ